MAPAVRQFGGVSTLDAGPARAGTAANLRATLPEPFALEAFAARVREGLRT